MSEAAAPTPDDSARQFLRCPDCLGQVLGSAGLECVSCGASYAIEAGIPVLIGRASQLNTSEVQTQDHVSDDYDGIRYGRSTSVKYHEDTMEQLVQLAPPAGMVLDDGCGTGAFLEFAERRGAQVERYVGIDVSRGMLRHAQRRLKRAGGDQLLVQADACRLPFAENMFDVVYARGMLHHLPDPARGMQEIRRVLKPGGLAVVLDPNKTLISRLPRYLARRTDHFDDDHKSFRASELERLVKSALTLVETRFYGYVAYPLLGFPDLIDFERLGISRLAGGLMRIDRMLGVLPGIRRLGWGVMISARK
jgi:ubiquinone/menaquinone biosynthesis C-methylase UbiE